MGILHFRGLRTTVAASVMISAQSLAAPTLEELGNIPYVGIYDDPVQLVNGVYEGEPFVPGGVARPRVELLGDLFVTEDIDGDGTEDAFVLLSESSGGTGNILYLAAVTRPDGTPRNVGSVKIGDRVDVMALRVADGEAILDYVAAGPDEPACCPTLMVSARHGMSEGRFVQLSREEHGTLSVDQLAGTPWRLLRFDWDEPVPEGIGITAGFRGDRISGSAGCNDYFATVKAPTPYELSIGPVGATRMACSPPEMEAEGRFLEALGNAKQFSFVLGNLVIDYQVGERHSSLVFERAETD